MKIEQIRVRSVLTKSRIPGIDYSVNPYVGCEFGCRYCYAEFMKKFTGHTEPWGEFVDVKVNVAERLRSELKRSKPGLVAMSLVTDPYQPLEKQYRLTRRCLEVLLEFNKFYSVSILTRSPLVLRDMDLIEKFREIEVGLSITTDDESIRLIFEPKTHSISSRIETLRRLKSEGIRTFAFVGPILPMKAENLAQMLVDVVDAVYLDRMNYQWKTAHLYRKHGIDFALREEFFKRVSETFSSIFARKGIHADFVG